MNRVALRLSTLALALTALAGARSASAQVSSPIKFGLGGGLTVPTGDAGDLFSSGYHGQAMLGFSAPVIPVGLRADVIYHNLGGKDGFAADLKVLGGGVNVLYDLPGIMLRPFLSGGVGMYNVKFDAENDVDDADDTKFGFNVGAGMKFNLTGFNTFVEARYYSIQGDVTDANFFPITFGIMF